MTAHPEIDAKRSVSSFAEFEKNFKYQGDDLYALIFQRNRDKIKLSKEKFAVKNLQKIFEANFAIAPRIGFQAMSLRDLSSETGLSMGGLYSSIASKEAIAIIVKDVVTVICDEIVQESLGQDDPMVGLESLIRGYLYASTIMQAWFNFLYFETKSLPQEEQEQSKNLELAQVEAVASLIKRLCPDTSEFNGSEFVANMVLSTIQERYLKPWKYPKPEESVDEYADHCLALISRAIALP